MKIVLEKNKLNQLLDILSKIRPETFQFVFNKNKLECIGGDSVLYFKNEIELNEKVESVSFSINSSLFCEIIRKINNDSVSLEFNKDNLFIIKSGNSLFKLNVINGENAINYDFVLDETNKTILSVSNLNEAINTVAFACAFRENRPILTGINIKNNRLVGLDAARLSLIEMDDNFLNYNITVPHKEIASIVSLLKGENVIVSLKNNLLLFKQDNSIFATRLLEGEYPDVNRLLPKSEGDVLTVDRLELLNTLELTSLITNEKRTIKFVIGKNKLTISSQENEIGKSKTCLDCEFTSKDKFEILLNAQYLIDALKVLKKEKVSIAFLGSLKPLYIIEDNIIELLTPIRG